MITVNSPGGHVISFPDGTDAATIAKVMDQALGSTSAQDAPAIPPHDGQPAEVSIGLQHPGPDFAAAFDASSDKPDVFKPVVGSPFNARLNNALTLGLGHDMAGVGNAVVQGVREASSGQPVDLGEAYQQGRNADIARSNAYQKANPASSRLADIGGTLGSIAVMGPGKTANRLASLGSLIKEGAVSGATVGGLAGLGNSDGDPAERLVDAASGAGTGAVLGAAMAPVAEGASRVLQSRVINPVRGWLNPEAEAARRIAVARQADKDAGLIQLTPRDEATAATNGQPVTNLDRGGKTTQALAQSAANTSPAGRQVLEEALGDRFASQGSRLTDVVQRIAGPATTSDTMDALANAARNANRPAYARAYGDPKSRGVWDSSLEQLATAPVVQDAIKQASVTGRNAGALNGFAPIKSPFTVDAAGRVALGTDANGNRVLPNLQFWDHVKRNLDAVGTREAQQASRVLRDHLDQIVPAYKAARAGAAKFFGANDALEAGDQFVMSRMGNDEARKALAKMSNPERTLFGIGFANSLVRRVGEVSDRQNVINATFLRSAASKERINMALGPEKAKELEAFLRVEDLMNKSRAAITGQSSTARQLIELGLAGGSGLYGFETGDWKHASYGLGAALASRFGAGIDRRVAQMVAQKLASADPAVVHQGIRIIAKSGKLLGALRRAVVTAGARQATNLLPRPQAALQGAQ